MKKNIFYLLFFAVFVLLLANCEKETFLPISKLESTQSAVKVSFVKLSDISQIRDFLVDKTNTNLFKSTVIDGAIFDEDHIMEVIDSLQHTNYSFRFRYTDTPVGTFYNLIVGKTPEGENETPYVLKYVCDESQLDEYIANNFDFRFFKGKVAIHKYTDFFSVGSILKVDSDCPTNTDENGNPIPCVEVTVIGNGDNTTTGDTQDGGNTGGGDGPNTGDGPNDGGGSTGNTNNDSGGTDSNGSTDSGNSDSDGTENSSDGSTDSGNSDSSGTENSSDGNDNSDSSGGDSGGGGLCFVPIDIYMDGEYIGTASGYVECGSSGGGQISPQHTPIVITKAGNDCPECLVPIGPVGVLPDINSVEVINYLYSENSPYDVDMSTVLDSINLPVPDSTKIANEKFLCVYDKLTTSNTFKNLFINTFRDSDKFNVTFKVTKNLKHNGERVNGLFSGLSNPLRNTATGEIVSFETQIEIDQDLLTNNSNFNAAKTVLHESIHAYLALKLLECNPNFPYNYYDGLELSEMVFLFYDNLCNGTISQHELMFDYMLPTFEEIFTQIGINNLASQDDLTNFMNDPDLNWEDFLFYFSMQGLHNTQVFLDEIQNDPNKLAKFSRYVTASKNLNKECE